MMLNVHCLCKMKDNKILSKTKIYEVLYLGFWVIGSDWDQVIRILAKFFFFCMFVS